MIYVMFKTREAVFLSGFKTTRRSRYNKDTNKERVLSGFKTTARDVLSTI